MKREEFDRVNHSQTTTPLSSHIYFQVSSSMKRSCSEFAYPNEWLVEKKFEEALQPDVCFFHTRWHTQLLESNIELRRLWFCLGTHWPDIATKATIELLLPLPDLWSYPAEPPLRKHIRKINGLSTPFQNYTANNKQRLEVNNLLV